MILTGQEARNYLRDRIQYFAPDELQCPCGCGTLVIDTVTVNLIELLRDTVGFPLVVNSGCRCAHHNQAVGGMEDSEHLTCSAVDIRCNASATRFAILNAAIKLGFKRIGIAKTFIHLGTSASHPQRVVWMY